MIMTDTDVQGFVPVGGQDSTDAVPDVPDVQVAVQPLETPEASETPDETAEGDDADAPDAEATPSDEKAAESGAAKVSKPEKLYFVRLPKPDLSELEIEIEKSKAQFNSLKDGCDILLATLKVQRVYQDEAKRDFESALEVFQQSNAEQKRWIGELEPFRQANKVVSDRRTALKENLRGLPARSETELDQMLEQIEFDLSHVTMSRHEENRLIDQMKKLEAARPRVRQAQSEVEAVDSSQDQLVEFKASKQELEKKLDIIREEVTEAKAIKDARWEKLKEIREKTKSLSDEFGSMREQKDTRWGELNVLRDLRKAKLDRYYENRRFSQRVRGLLGEGKFEEAQAECDRENDEMISQLVADAKLWQEYVSLWEMQRKYAVSQADIELDTGAPVKARAAPAAAAGKSESGAQRAKEIIKELMLEADVELGKVPKPAAAAAAAAAAGRKRAMRGCSVIVVAGDAAA